jgi:hypothetical protein
MKRYEKLIGEMRRRQSLQANGDVSGVAKRMPEGPIVS